MSGGQSDMYREMEAARQLEQIEEDDPFFDTSTEMAMQDVSDAMQRYWSKRRELLLLLYHKRHHAWKKVTDEQVVEARMELRRMAHRLGGLMESFAKRFSSQRF